MHKIVLSWKERRAVQRGTKDYETEVMDKEFHYHHHWQPDFNDGKCGQWFCIKSGGIFSDKLDIFILSL